MIAATSHKCGRWLRIPQELVGKSGLVIFVGTLLMVSNIYTTLHSCWCFLTNVFSLLTVKEGNNVELWECNQSLQQQWNFSGFATYNYKSPINLVFNTSSFLAQIWPIIYSNADRLSRSMSRLARFVDGKWWASANLWMQRWSEPGLGHC